MKKNKKGFTLIELIVTIAIIAAVSIAATLGLQEAMKTNKNNLYKNNLVDILSSTRTYLSVKKVSVSNDFKEIHLGDVVSEGYIEDKIYDKINVFNCENFTSDTPIYFKNINGERFIYMKDQDDNYCNLGNLESCNLREDC